MKKRLAIVNCSLIFTALIFVWFPEFYLSIDILKQIMFSRQLCLFWACNCNENFFFRINFFNCLDGEFSPLNTLYHLKQISTWALITDIIFYSSSFLSGSSLVLPLWSFCGLWPSPPDPNLEAIASKKEIHQYILYLKEKLVRLVIEIELQVSNNWWELVYTVCYLDLLVYS